MRRNSFLTFLKEKSFIIVLTLMLVSAGTMAALFTLGGTDESEKNEVAKKEEIQVETPLVNEAEIEETVDETANLLPKTRIIKKATDTEAKVKENTVVNMENAVLEAELEDQYLEALDEMAEVTTTDIVAEGFSDSAVITLQWPVEGEVLLPFSMDQSIYFKTLAQYQYNPAMLISASEGTEVFASAAGTVTDVGKSSEYGHYVTVDAGDGFEITYGQLFDISTEVGEQLEAGDRIAMVAYPTRAYIEEGDNLYFKLTQNGTAVDPALYLEN